ncbi:MAG: MFS transporter, partial [Spirochaetaceae bacterium]|nr:MFS transporter [Spirochaetaceae bacterium]
MSQDKKILQLFVFYTMMLASILLSSIPSLMTTVQELFSLNTSGSSKGPMIVAFGVMGANFLMGFLIAYTGLKRSLQLGFLIGIISTLIMSMATNYLVMLLGFLLTGIAAGACISSATTIFAHLAKEKQNYGLLHAFFGLGAATTPFVMAFFFRSGISFSFVLQGMSVLFLIGLILLSLGRFIGNVKYEPIGFSEAGSFIKKPIIFLPLLLFMFYAGTEMSTATWMGNLFEDLFHFSRENATTVLSVFWLSFTFGRIITQYLNKGLGYLATLYLMTLLLIAGFTVLLLTGWAAAMACIGLAMGPFFPTLQKYISIQLEHRQIGLFNGLSYGATGVGGMLINGLMGYTAEISLYISYSIPIG